jgi:dolichol-phosphate mannosyltransferase
LASACIEGMMSTDALYLAVMDADLQHDETLLPKLLETIKSKNLDLVVASRYIEGGSTGDWSRYRLFVSRLATRLGQFVMKADVKDPMSGFFILDRRLLHDVVRDLSGKGFKILLDICSTVRRPLRFEELSYEFRQRHAGESKLDSMVVIEYLYLIADKTIGRVIPVRFMFFVLVGLAGAVIHLLVLGVVLHIFGYPFWMAQTIAALSAMTINFTLNNRLTYKSHQLHGLAFLKGLLTFWGACGVGGVINILIAQHLFSHGIQWMLSGLLGAVIGGVWNFAITKNFTWRASGD